MTADVQKDLWIETPLILSRHLSHRLNCDVYLKLESLQPSQSFKYRGISHFIHHIINTRGRSTQLVIASSGNAGLGAATAANAFKMKCTVFLPHGATPAILRFFEREGAEVRFQGTCYPEAFKAAQLEATTNPNAVLIPAYDDPVIWEGYSSMVGEIARQLPPAVKPDALFCSVGGGGLAGGIMVGCKNVGWDDVPLVTMETTGSNCFYQSVLLNRNSQTGARALPPDVEIVDDPRSGVRLALLKKLTSRASSLGASMPSAGVVKMALERPGGVKCVCGPDELAMQTTLSFADDHKMLVELACSTTLIPAYNPALFEKLVPPRADGARRTVVFVVCGGFKIDFDELVEYESIVKKEVDNGVNTWETHVDGELVEIPKPGNPSS